MQRREFITFLGGAAAAWPLAVRAQQPERMRRVTVLLGLGEKDLEAQKRAKAFRLGMRDLGWIEGRNIQVDYRFTDSSVDSIKKNVAEVIALAPDVIVANSTPIIAALRPTTSTIPIVLAMVLDPVGQGFISNLARPGANITGFYFIDFEIVGKWVNLLTDVKPGLSQVALMFNPDTSAYFDSYLRSFKTLQQPSSVEVKAMHVRSVAEVDLAIAQLARNPDSGLIAASDVFIVGARKAIIKSAEEHRVPVISPGGQVDRLFHGPKRRIYDWVRETGPGRPSQGQAQADTDRRFCGHHNCEPRGRDRIPAGQRAQQLSRCRLCWSAACGCAKHHRVLQRHDRRCQGSRGGQGVTQISDQP
jgi:putative tryptophan/tyrosine transport system substrate-binding protein